jgi:membrane protein DedA with SNARE-associated domain
MESLDIIQWCLDNLNYWTVAILMAIESSFIPFPSEIVVPPAAYKAAAGELNVVGVVLSASLGALIGALVNYMLAYYLGRPVIYKFAESRLGRACLLSQEKIEYSEKYFLEHGISSTLIGRLVPAVRQLISIPAGLAKMKMPVFLFYTFLGATLWNIILATIGYVLHSIVPPEMLSSAIQEYKPYLFWGGVAIFCIFVLYLVLSSRKKK